MRQLDYIAHHGILGQKWGVRRWQNSDGSLTPEGRKHYSKLENLSDKDVVIKAGSKMQRISSNTTGDAKNKKYTFVSYTKNDNEFYEKQYSKELMESMIASGKTRASELDIYKLEVTATKDIISPSERKRVEEFVRMYENDKIGISKELGREALAMQFDANADSLEKSMNPDAYKQYTNYYAKQFQSLSPEDVRSDGYRYFIGSFYRDTPMKSEYFNTFAKKGYNAVVDDNDVIQGLEAPLILLKPKKTTKITKSEKIMGIDDLDPMRKLV